MLSKIHLNNFKGFEGQHAVKLAPLTLIYGANSAGKSAILKSLAAIKQSTPSSPLEELRRDNIQFNFYGPLVDLGGFRNSVFMQDPNKSISMGITSENMQRLNSSIPPGLIEKIDYVVDLKWNNIESSVNTERVSLSVSLNNGEDIELQFYKKYVAENEINNLDDRIVQTLELFLDDDQILQLSKYIYSVAEFYASRLDSTNERRNIRIRDIEKYKEVLEYEIEEIANHIASIYSKSSLSFRMSGFLVDPIFSHRIMDSRAEREDLFYSFILDLILEARQIFRREINGITYVGPFRYVPNRIEANQSEVRRRDSSDGSNLTEYLSSQNVHLQRVNNWLNRLDIPYEIEIQRLGVNEELPSVGEFRSLIFKDKRTGAKLSAQDLGFGISQILPVIVACTDKRSNLIMIEQPELHIHPKLQLEIAELFRETMAADKQLIIETHSENLILRLQKLVRIGQISSDQISIVYVGALEETGSWIEQIDLLPSGELSKEWPGGFFTERISEWM